MSEGREPTEANLDSFFLLVFFAAHDVLKPFPSGSCLEVLRGVLVVLRFRTVVRLAVNDPFRVATIFFCSFGVALVSPLSLASCARKWSLAASTSYS